MTNRRNFLKTSIAVALGAAAVSRGLQAETDAATTAAVPSFAGIIYSKENAGKWAGKVNGHAPVVTLDAGKVSIFTDHSMSEKHYIVRHTLVTQAGEVLGEKTFSPKDDEAKSEFVLPEGASGVFYATSFCNKHDFWLTAFSV